MYTVHISVQVRIGIANVYRHILSKHTATVMCKHTGIVGIHSYTDVPI